MPVFEMVAPDRGATISNTGMIVQRLGKELLGAAKPVGHIFEKQISVLGK
jgi:hypothetical protein